MLRKAELLRLRLFLDDPLKVLLKAQTKTISGLRVFHSQSKIQNLSYFRCQQEPILVTSGKPAEVYKVEQYMERKNKLLTRRRKKEEPTPSINLKLITDISTFRPGQISTLPKPQQLTHLLATSDRSKTKRAWKLDKHHSSIGGPFKKRKKRKIMKLTLSLCILLMKDRRHPFPVLSRLIKLHLPKFTF